MLYLCVLHSGLCALPCGLHNLHGPVLIAAIQHLSGLLASDLAEWLVEQISGSEMKSLIEKSNERLNEV